MSSEIQKLLQLIERRLDWGEPAQWQSRDFDVLNQRILEETGVSLSASTLKRVWGRASYSSAPSGVTLDTLARFAGFASYRAFLSSERPAADPRPAAQPAIDAAALPTIDAPAPPRIVEPAPRSFHWSQLVLIIGGVLALALIGALAFKRKPPHRGPYQFSSHTVVARGVPNSVVFSYDAPVADGDSVFIQQSWDWTRRELVDPGGHQHTSIYYHPGFFQAKLVVDTEVVLTHTLMIATEGWLGMVENEPVPVYLKPAEFLTDTLLRLPIGTVAQKVPFTPAHPPKVRFFNVGNFDPIPVPLLSFSADIKNEYGDGAGACRRGKVYLITDDGFGTIQIPFSAKGCASDLNLFCVDHGVSGKNADLSGFGLDTARWTTIACKAAIHDIQFLVNGRPAYTLPLPDRASNVVGVEFVFEGTGEVKAVRLSKGDHTVLKAF
jgi:hypothetical protein